MTVRPLSDFRKTLFWDVNPEKLDTEKDAEFIIGRVLDYGNPKEWRTIKRIYGELRIAVAAKRHLFIDPRGANFWALMLSIPVDQLKCTRNPSLQIPNAFLNR